ncbi:MAG: CPBP family glutamic-type intramembrane protease [Pseudomonadota bacterium]
MVVPHYPRRAIPPMASLPREAIVAFVNRSALFGGLAAEEHTLLADHCELKTFAPGQTILQQGQNYNTLMVLFHGHAEVIIDGGASGKPFVLANLEPGAQVGEKGFMDLGTAAASVVAQDSVTTLCLSRQAAQKCGLYQAIIESIAGVQADRLQQANAKQINAMQAIIDRQAEQNAFGRFYIATIMLFAVSSFVPDYANESPSFQLFIRWVFLILILLPALYAVSQQKAPVSVFGITTAGWKRALMESLLVALAILPLMVLFKIMGAPADEPLITWATIANYSGAQLALYIITYVPHSAIQEFIARGVGQGSLQRFMADAHFLKPIVLAGLLFAILHLHLSIGAAALTFGISLLFGYLYYRHKSLVGVTVLHILLGLSATALGLI